MTATSESGEIRILRTYDAPMQAVWDAWTDPAQVAQWWGPRGFTLTTHSKDLRSGGSWAYTMHGPDGADYPNKTLYLEVQALAKLVYDHGGNDDRPPMFRVTVVFAEADGKTRMDMCMSLPSAHAAAQTASSSSRPAATPPGTAWPNTWPSACRTASNSSSIAASTRRRL